MKHSSVFFQAVRFCTVILVGVLLLPLAPAQSPQVAASIPDESLSPAQRPADQQPGAPAQAWTRILEPVVVSGSQLSLFSGVALADLFVYAYDGSTWHVVPFQFDEVNSAGEGGFVPFEDGLLDADDQLVFMAADLGSMATPYEWVNDADSKSHSRYEVHVTNPLNAAEEGWVYVYHSATLAPTFAPYVTWDGASNRIVASNYIVGYVPAAHLGIDSLELNGLPGDVLDRSKFRLSGECRSDEGVDHFDLTENSEEILDSWDPPDIAGPVRAGGGHPTEYSWAYASMFEDRWRFSGDDVSKQCDRLTYDLLRISEDWRNPVESGMAPMGYFDSNTPLGVAVDGQYDPIPSTPFPEWRQVSGAKGSVVEAMDIGAGEPEVRNYYLDLMQEDSDDTGDLRSFGDAGFQVISPGSSVLISIVHYVLDAFQLNVGEMYRQYYTNPIQAEATAQDFVEATPHAVHFTWSPRPVFSGVVTTFTVTVDGLPPFTYDWDFGDDGSVASGNPLTHTFTLTGTFPVSLDVTNDWGTASAASNVLVWEPGAEVPLIYVPLVLRNAP